MADLQFDDFEGNYAASTADGRLERARHRVSIAGAVCSVALVLGLGFWGYRLAVRDVAGVPVMRAMLGPMRVAPADPGGNQASNQGLSVNAVAATGTSAPVADELTLAPRATELQPGDTSAASNTGAVIGEVGETTPVNLSISGQANPANAPTLLSGEVAPLEEGAATLIDVATGSPVDVTDADPESATSPASTYSLRPQPRPASLAASETQVSNVENVAAPGPLTEIDPASLATGTRLAQLGAFDTPDLAREKFAQLQSQFGDLMAGKALVIQAAQSGGRSFYRLRAHGFAGDDEARRFCAALQAEDADCIPVAQR